MSEKPNPNALGGHVKRVDLTPQQRKEWHTCCAAFMSQAPGFRYLWTTMLCKSDDRNDYAIFTRDIPTAATDGYNVLINPDFFFGSNEFDKEAAARGGVKSLRHWAERVFVLYHEVQHNVFNDVGALHKFVKSGKVPMNGGGTLPFDMDVAQRAADFRINALGVESKIGRMPHDCKCYDLKIAGPTTSFADAYRNLFKKKQEDERGGGGEGDGKAKDPQNGGFDEVLPPGNTLGKEPDEAAGERSEQKWKVEINIARSLTKGTMAAGMKKMFDDILEPEVYWVDHIRGFFNRKVGSGTYNWRKPDRRFIVRDLYMPGRTGFGAKHVVFLCDTSGSIISDVEKGLAELTGIMEDVKPAKITVIWCDAAIHGVEELEDANDLARLRAKGAKGGGGSNMRPGFDWVKKHCDEPPDALVCFTDLLVTFPESEPNYPVVWCAVLDGKPPFGDYVRVHVKNGAVDVDC